MSQNKPENRRSAQTATPLKEAFRGMLDKYQLSQKFDETHIIVYWEKIMGKAIANRTSQIYIKDKVMFVSLTSAPLRQELSQAKSTILQLFEKEVGEGVIQNVVFK
jgi:predicted nucleic acid-binding Zn ribbon protein